MTRTRTARHAAVALAASFAVVLAMAPVTSAPARGAGADTDTTAAANFLARVAALRATASREATAGTAAIPPGDPLKTLPSACRFDIRDGPNRGTWYGRPCLVANFAHWPFLPDHCERRLELPRRRPDLAAYDATCLAQFGFGPDDGALDIRQ